ncbi:MAG TPA: GDSL-type esterase/lipase family protein [Sporichthyaceae bacterium]
MRTGLDHVRRLLVTALSMTSLTFAGAAAATIHAPHAEAAPPSAPSLSTGAAAVHGHVAPPAGRGPVVVALGDSVPAGSVCGCRNFVATYGDLLSRGAAHKAAVTNFAEGGAETEDVLEQVRKPAVRDALTNATTVLLMIGANDFYRPFKHVRRGASAATEYRAAARQVRTNVEQTIRQIRLLHDGPVNIVVLGYWNVVEDGKVARQDYGTAGVKAAESATGWANRALRGAARTGHALYVSTYAAFKGADGSKDPTALLASDGDHPNAAGHRLLARTVYGPLPKG